MNPVAKWTPTEHRSFSLSVDRGGIDPATWLALAGICAPLQGYLTKNHNYSRILVYCVVYEVRMRVEVSWRLPLQQQQARNDYWRTRLENTLPRRIYHNSWCCQDQDFFRAKIKYPYFDQKSNSISVYNISHESWRILATPTTTTSQDIIINDHDLKIMFSVICKEGFIRYRGVAKIRTFASRSGLLRAWSSKNLS